MMNKSLKRHKWENNDKFLLFFLFWWTILLTSPVFKSRQYQMILLEKKSKVYIHTLDLPGLPLFPGNHCDKWTFHLFYLNNETEAFMRFFIPDMLCYSLFFLHRFPSIGWALTHNFLSIRPCLLWTRLRRGWLDLSNRYVLWLVSTVCQCVDTEGSDSENTPNATTVQFRWGNLEWVSSVYLECSPPFLGLLEKVKSFRIQ